MIDKISSIKKEDLVSIIMPAYNCSDFISMTIESVIKQTYQNWELIIVDDCSTDNTINVIRKFKVKYSRIKCHSLKKNSGAAVARNKAVDLAKGRYLAFLDSDDIWLPEKLTRQIKFMKENNYTFTCTKYNKIGENGEDLGRIIDVREKSNYNDILKKNPGNSTVIYDTSSIEKIKIPNIRKRNDYVMWLGVIKKSKYLYGMDEVLSSHRIREGSLSKKKVNLITYHWKVYREIEKLTLIKSIYLIVYWIIVTVFKLR